MKATSEKITAEKAAVDVKSTAEKAVLEKTADLKSVVAKISETEEVAISSTKHDHCAQTSHILGQETVQIWIPTLKNNVTLFMNC